VANRAARARHDSAAWSSGIRKAVYLRPVVGGRWKCLGNASAR